MLNRVQCRIRHASGDTRSIFKLVGGTAAAQALAVILTPIMTRLYSPEVYGEVSVLLSITSIASIIICLRYDPAIVVPTKDKEGLTLYRLSLWIATGLSLVFGAILLVFHGPVLEWANAPTLSKYWYFIPILLFLTGIANAGNYWLTRKNEFGSIARNSLISTLGATVPAIILGLAGFQTVLSRVISTTVGTAAWALYIYIMASRVTPEGTSLPVNWRDYLPTMVKYKVFLVFDVWSTLANTLSWQLVPIVMNSIYGAQAAGQYALGLRIIQIPMSLIGSAISQVFFRTASERRDRRELNEYLKQMARRLFFLSVGPTIIIGLSGKWLFAVVFGKGWETAGLFCQILAPWAILWLVASSISPIFMVLQAQKILLGITLMNLLLRVGAIYLGRYLGGATMGVILFSLSGILVYGSLLLTAFHLARKSDMKPSPNLGLD